MEIINEVDKPKVTKTVVVYSGRFQPFHRGHYASYKKLVNKFGVANVFIGTSNDTSGPKSPFNFSQKKKIATTMFDIPSNRFVKVNNPYKPAEILSKFDGQTTQYIAAVGEKDADRLQGKYFKPYKDKAGYGYDEIGYVYAVPAEPNPISGTDVRNNLGSGDEKKAKKFFLTAYPKFDKNIFDLITGKLVNETLYRGYPSKEQVLDIEKKNKELRKDLNTDKEYLYNPIEEIIVNTISKEMFDEWLMEYLNEVPNPILDKEIEYTNTKGEKEKIKARHALRLAKDHPAHVAAEKLIGDDDTPLSDTDAEKKEKGLPTDKDKPSKEKSDTQNQTQPEQEPPGKLSGAELKSDAEKNPTDDKEQIIKQSLDKERAELSKEENETIDKMNDPNSEDRKGFFETLGNLGKKIGQAFLNWGKKKWKMIKGTFGAVKELATTGRLGSVKDKEGNNRHWSEFTEKDENGKPKMKDTPVYKEGKKPKGFEPDDNNIHMTNDGWIGARDIDPETGFFKKNDNYYDNDGDRVDGKTGYKTDDKGNPVQRKTITGKPKTKKEPIFKEGLSDEEKELGHSSWEKRHHQIHDMKHFAMDASLLIGSMVVGGAGLGLAAKAGSASAVGAATTGATSAFTHGVGPFAAHLGKDVIKHATFEVMGMEAASASGAGAGLSIATGGLLEMVKDENDTNKFISNVLNKIIEKTKTYKLSDEQLLKSIKRYKKDKPKQNAADLLKENLSETKQQSIQNFVEFVTKRLKLKETPKITLIGGREFSETKSSLGGFNPITKEIYVATEGRLTADILRTLAHEMVHRKQDEMGLVRNPKKDGKDGSPIENQAHAVAGILMREYGRINKQIYQEGFNGKNHKPVSQADHDFTKHHSDDMGKDAELDTIDFDDSRKKEFGHQSNTKDDEVHGYEPVKKENINVDVNAGDTILMGKFKNKKVQIKDIGKDQHGMPTINGKQATTFRTLDEMGSKDIHFSSIIKHYRDSKFRKRINAYLFDNPNGNKSDEVARRLRNMDYDDITKMEKDLNLPNKNLEELNYTEKNNPAIKKVYDTIKSNYKSLQNLNFDTKNKTYTFAFGNKKDADKMEKDFKGVGSSKMKLSRKADYGNDKPPVFVRVFGVLDEVDSFLNELFNISEVSNVSTSTIADIPDGAFIPKGKKRKLNTDKGEDWYKNGGYTQTDFPKADAIFGDEDADERTIKYTIDNLPRVKFTPTKFIKENKEETKQLIMEGGAYGHMSHPFDDMQLTFGQLKDIIQKALDGELGVVREKTDGQALAISWKNGRLIAARNKGHLANAGANAMGIEEVASKFAGRGGLTDAYNFAMKDLSAAISGLSDKQRKKIFNEGKCFMNLEVIWPTSVNVIPYGQALLVFHNTTCYDESGVAVGADQGAAGMLAGMIKQVNADVQSKYTIQGPPVTEIPKNENLSSKKGKYISKLGKLQSEFKLNDSDTMAVYHQKWWENFIDKNAPIKVDKLTKNSLVRRWAFGDKSFRLNTISNVDLQKWAMDTDKVDVVKKQKENMKSFEQIFLGVGADVLDFVGSVLTVHPNKAIRSMKAKLKSVADQIKSSADATKINKFKSELARLNSLGGIDRIVASEGIVFFYNGKTYKLTGTFAPLNQLLGIFYE